MIETVLTIIVVIVAFFLLLKICKLILRIVVVVLFLGIAYLTNPALEDHQHVVTQKAAEEEIDLQGKKVVADDYKVFSLTRIVEDGKEKLVGVGAFTKVFIFRSL